MIPVRVMVRGFLSYKDQTELTFDSAKLWMLSGRNGAGKSAIFDAITFALFGAGRFDNPVVKEYIHHDSKDMDIEFDFDLDDKRYRVKRTASRRAASTYQAYTLDRQNNLTPPLPIPGTETNRPFETWVERTLNMNCNTFVASAMLRQGDSDRLLSSRDTDRALIMSRIVDISAYEKLHGFVNEQAKDFENEKFRLQTALTQLETDIKVDAKKAINRFGWPEDNYLLQQDLIVSAKRLMIQLAEKEKEASVEAQRLQILLDAMNRIQATLTGWKQKVVQRTELSIQKAAYRGILERLPEIERRAARLQELAATIPTRQLWNTARITWRTAKTCHTNTLAEIERLDKVLTQLEAQLTPAENRLSEAKIKMTNATEALGKYRAELKVLQNRQGNLLNIEGNAMCNICGKELTEEQRQEQIDIVAEAIEAATEKVKVAIGAKDATGKSVEDTEREVKRLSVELRSTADKIKDAEKAYALAAQTMLTSEANATRILQDAGRFYQTCAAFIVNEKPYMPEDICAMLLNDLVLIKALEMGTYPTEENTQAAQKELQSLKGADADKRELDQAKQDAGDLDTQIGTYVSLQQVDEIQIAEDTNGLSEDFRSALIQAMASTNKSIEEHLSVVVAIDANTNQAERHLRETEAKKRVDASTSKPGEWVMKQIELNSTARSKSQQQEKDAHDHQLSMKHNVSEYEQKKEYWRNVAKQASIYRTLQKKLDRNGLQSWLRVAAEQSIVANADHTLQRLSNGMLTMKLADNGKGESLDLRVTDHEKGARDLRTQALSGSQKFRVSVALALGIGQYACGQSQGGIKSVIIDEGFGSLDKEGRDQMITELQNLGKVLERIIVVSHQEEFQTAFANRWHIFVEGDTAKACLIV